MNLTNNRVVNKFSRKCPYCYGEMIVERLRCGHCNVAVEGAFETSPLTVLHPDQQDLVVEYLKLSGSLKDLAAAKGVSYPTIRLRMDKIIETLNLAGAKCPEERRSQSVLEALEKGEISVDEAEEMLKKKEGKVT
jgi:hypothetical protein